MAKILIAWELGGGLGHLVRLVPIVNRLRQHGHQIFAAVRDLSRVDGLYAGCGVSFLQAPIKTLKQPYVKEPRTFAHILCCNGFADEGELRGMSGGWRSLYQLVQPDLIICDHAPTALLAARACDARRVIIGTGFACPPDACPLPDLRPWLPDGANQLVEDEDLVLRNVNAVLDSWRLPPLGRLSQLYGEIDRTFLTTFKELDHYPHRNDPEYYGTWLTPGGDEPRWATVSGPRIFAYLKPFATLPALLEAVRETGCATIVYIDGVASALREKFESPMVSFASERLDLSAVGASCDLAILNGGHNGTCQMLLAGKPIMTVPLNLEQAYNGSSVAKVSAGFGVLPEHPTEFARTLSNLLGTDQYRHGAERFAAKYSDFSPSAEIENISVQLDGLARAG
jgi:hypothetical protein